ncbi:MAG TPA: ADP-ribosylglycohydrolase family protein [Dehalococcoidia bacterium]|jgi:ADP-ribosyl-[dinitrogen reductase] hydrolase|nr:ADP-ribosylglycohydrolase family protein [Dehalococcoidia bacterium]
MKELLSHFQGCLVGVAVGDALGAPVEGMSPEHIRSRWGQVTEMMAGRGWGRGEHTDDTAMTLCLARSLVERGEFEPEDVAARFLDWFQAGAKGIGRTTLIALSELGRGASWQEASLLAHHRLGGLSAGNGSIMRCAPIGLFYYRRPDRLIEASLESALITHWDPRAGWAAVALNLLIAGLVQGRKEGLLEEVAGLMDNEEVSRVLLEASAGARERLVPSAYVLDTLKAALGCFLQAPSFEAAVVSAVNLGGDTDTTGAVCGALAGAYFGLGGVPHRWLEPLYAKEELLDLAGRIYALAQP